MRVGEGDLTVLTDTQRYIFTQLKEMSSFNRESKLILFDVVTSWSGGAPE